MRYTVTPIIELQVEDFLKIKVFLSCHLKPLGWPPCYGFFTVAGNYIGGSQIQNTIQVAIFVDSIKAGKLSRHEVMDGIFSSSGEHPFQKTHLATQGYAA